MNFVKDNVNVNAEVHFVTGRDLRAIRPGLLPQNDAIEIVDISEDSDSGK